MEPISTIAATVIGILTPYVAKGAEEFIKAAGKDAYEKTKRLFGTLKARWSGDQEASEALTRFEEKPERYEPVMKSILEEQMLNDPSLASEISRLLNEIGPQVHVIQKMKEGKNVTGVDIEDMSKGKASVEQEIDKAEDVTGAKIKRLG